MKPLRWWADRWRGRWQTRVLLCGDRVELVRSSRCLDLFTRRGALLTMRYSRRPAAAYETVREHERNGTGPARWVLNTRPLFIGIGGDNLVELGVWRWAWLATWVPDDFRLIARRDTQLACK